MVKKFHEMQKKWELKWELIISFSRKITKIKIIPEKV